MDIGARNEILRIFGSMYTEGRETVKQDVRNVTESMARWRGPDPQGIITISSLIIHLAGYENMLRSALLGEDIVAMTARPQWRARFGPGFPREMRAVGVEMEPPVDRAFKECLALLRCETQKTTDLIAAFDSHDIDLDASTPFYEDGREFQADRMTMRLNSSLLFDKAMHDRYHRGHITQIKYTYGVLVSADRARAS